MMTGKFVEYNWKDVEQLIMRDAGLVSEEDQRQRAQVWFVGEFSPPAQPQDTCVRVFVYDKPFDERFEEHAGRT
jgi:hypothetical protein